MKFEELLMNPHSYKNIIRKHAVLLTISRTFHTKV